MRLFGMSPEDTQGAILLFFFFVIYLRRNDSPTFRMIWDVFAMVMIIIFAICSFGLLLGAAKRLFK